MYYFSWYHMPRFMAICGVDTTEVKFERAENRADQSQEAWGRVCSEHASPAVPLPCTAEGLRFLKSSPEFSKLLHRARNSLLALTKCHLSCLQLQLDFRLGTDCLWTHGCQFYKCTRQNSAKVVVRTQWCAFSGADAGNFSIYIYISPSAWSCESAWLM